MRDAIRIQRAGQRFELEIERDQLLVRAFFRTAWTRAVFTSSFASMGASLS